MVLSPRDDNNEICTPRMNEFYVFAGIANEHVSILLNYLPV
jgi:hypothetical protein